MTTLRKSRLRKPCGFTLIYKKRLSFAIIPETDLLFIDLAEKVCLGRRGDVRGHKGYLRAEINPPT